MGPCGHLIVVLMFWVSLTHLFPTTFAVGLLVAAAAGGYDGFQLLRTPSGDDGNRDWAVADRAGGLGPCHADARGAAGAAIGRGRGSTNGSSELRCAFELRGLALARGLKTTPPEPAP